MSARRNVGRFVPGTSYSPETQIRPGQHLSARTEFQPGQPAHNRLPVGSVTIRTLDGVRRAFVKIAEPSVWRERAKVEWERANGGPVPRGRVIHHRDRDSLNDDPKNLVALTRKEHALEHIDDARSSGFGSSEARTAANAARRMAC